MEEQKRQSHWDNIFKTKDYTQVLWHQTTPTVSLDLITNYSNKDDAIIDVGCGASFLVDNLIDKGYKDITLLDTSKTSLDIVKKRLTDNSDIPTYTCSDIMHFTPKQSYNIWHDRAVFHFLLYKEERVNYFEKVLQSLSSGSVAIISTFRIGGQTQCAGLDIIQYNHTKMLEELPQDLKLIKYEEFTHITPSESKQEYSSFIIEKV